LIRYLHATTGLTPSASFLPSFLRQAQDDRKTKLRTIEKPSSGRTE
jgi:hypothetical protein